MLHFTATQPPYNLQQIATVIRAISNIPQIAIDTSEQSISLHGTAGQVALCEWLFTNLDKPNAPASAVKHEYRVSDSADDVVRLFFLTNPEIPGGVQEMATAVRSLVNVRQLFVYEDLRAVAVRGTEEEIRTVEFLFDEMDKPAIPPGQKLQSSTSPEFRMNQQPENFVRVLRGCSSASYGIGRASPPRNAEALGASAHRRLRIGRSGEKSKGLVALRMAGIDTLLRFVEMNAAMMSGVLQEVNDMLADRDSRAAAVQITLDPARNSIAAACAADAPVCSPAGDFTLVVTEGESLGKRVPVGHVPVVIGRGVGVDLQVMDPTVSRHHCVVWRASGRCWVRDLGSTNRTRVNKRSSLITELFDGDVVVIGQTALTIGASRPESEHARQASHNRRAPDRRAEIDGRSTIAAAVFPHPGASSGCGTRDSAMLGARARVAKSVDARDLKSLDRRVIPVRIRARAPNDIGPLKGRAAL